MYCPKCGNDLRGDRCSVCVYDRSSDWLLYPTLTPVDPGMSRADPEEERLRSMYETALAVERAAVTEAGFSAAALLYEQLGKPGWRDSARRARQCRAKVRQMEREEQEQAERKRLEQERQERERRERERQERERQEQERRERERQEQERRERVRQERERAEREHLERERLARERERQEQERLERERVRRERERLEWERQAAVRRTASAPQSVRPQAQSVRPQAQPVRPQAQPVRPQAQPVRPQAQPVRPQAQPVRPQPQVIRTQPQTVRVQPQVIRMQPTFQPRPVKQAGGKKKSAAPVVILVLLAVIVALYLWKPFKLEDLPAVRDLSNVFKPTASPRTTSRPTAKPTARPTAKPTAAPTATPTVRPTAGLTVTDHVTDWAGMMAEDERKELDALAGELSEAYQIDIRIITEGTISDEAEMEQFSDNVIERFGLGYGDDRDCIMILYFYATGRYYLISSGYGEYAFDNYGLRSIISDIHDYMADSDWYNGFSLFLEDCVYYLERALDGDPVREEG